MSLNAALVPRALTAFLCRGSPSMSTHTSTRSLYNGISWSTITSASPLWMIRHGGLLGSSMWRDQRPCEASAYGTEAASSSAATPEPPIKPKEKREAIRNAINSSTDISEIINRQKGPRGFKVIEFLPQGVAKDRKNWVTPQSLGIHPRDLSLFQTGSRLAIQRATIVARDGAIFIKTEAVSAIISPDKAVVLKSRREKENENIIAPMLKAIDAHDQLPFELCAMEALLHATVMYFERRISLLSWMLEIMLNELQAQTIMGPFAAVSNESMIRGLVPLDKALTSARNDAKETCAAIQGVLDDDDALSSVCLTEQRNAMASIIGDGGDIWSGPGHVVMDYAAKPAAADTASSGAGLPLGLGNTRPASPALPRVPNHALRQADRMLQSYEREMSSVESTLREMEENLATTRESWRMKLDSARNHMMLVNLWLSMLAISMMLAALLPTAFGMNIKHGFEDTVVVFYFVTFGSILIGGLSFPFMFQYYKTAWKMQSEHELAKINRFRILLMQHLDDLDDILDVCGKMPGRANRYQFGAYLKERLPDLKLTSDTEDFLFSQFDVNRDGFFESHELLTKTAKELEAMGNSPHHVSSQMLRATGLSMSSINPANLSKDDLKTLRQHVKESMGRTHIKLQGSDGEPW